MSIKSSAIFLATCSLLVAPFATFAQTPAPAGTDDYLLSTLPNASQVLATPLVTEARMPFPIATTPSVDDPTGDVLTQNGTASNLHEPWGDLTNVTWTKEATDWLVTATVAAPVPATPAEQTQFTVYVDADGNPANNMPPPGTRGDMDSEWSIKYSSQYGWGVDFEWYNPAPTAKVWAMNKKTAAVPAISGNTLSLKIPFTELSANWSPRWRAIMALEDTNGNEEVDVVPGAGFPPANPNYKGPTTPGAPASATTSTVSSPANNTWIGILIAVIAVIVAGSAAFWFPRRPVKKDVAPADDQKK